MSDEVPGAGQGALPPREASSAPRPAAERPAVRLAQVAGGQYVLTSQAHGMPALTQISPGVMATSNPNLAQGVTRIINISPSRIGQTSPLRPSVANQSIVNVLTKPRVNTNVRLQLFPNADGAQPPAAKSPARRSVASPEKKDTYAAKLQRVLNHRIVRSKLVKEKYNEHLMEAYFLEAGGNILDLYQFAKRPKTPSYLAYLKEHSIDPKEYEEENAPVAGAPTATLASSLPGMSTPAVEATAAKTLQRVKTPTQSTNNNQEQIVEKAKQEAYVVQRISDLQKEGLWSEKRLPKVQEMPRTKAHWDFLLEEMVWLAADFAQERKWKKAAAKKCARMVQKYFQDKATAAQKAEKAHEQHLRRIAAFCAKEIKNFWNNVEKLVEYKQHTILEEKRKKALDQQLSFIVDQTEKYSQLLAEGMNRSSNDNAPPSNMSSAPVSRVNSDDEFQPDNQSSTDDEETIEQEEAVVDSAGQSEEVAALQRESEMDLEDFLNELPKDYLQNRDKIRLSDLEDSDIDGERPSGSKTLDNSKDDEDFHANTSSEEDDEDTIQEQEQNEGDQNHAQELEDLNKENEMSVEELRKKYSNLPDVTLEESDSSEESASEDEKDDSEESVDEAMEVSEEEEEEEEGGAGLKLLVEEQNEGDEIKTDKNNDLINDAAAIAESIQPKGNTLSSTNVSTTVPFLLRLPLREYQHIGLDWLVTMYDRKLNGILADEMGLGKTIQTIALLAHLACEKENWGPHLIVVPTSVMLNWEMECKKWCPAFKILTYYGSQKERKMKRTGWTKPNAFHICITSYKLVIQDHQSFRRKKWKYLILDEAQNIKNFKSQRWQLLLNFQTQQRLLLTGTPLQNNLMELWSLMHFLMPNVFQSHREFKEWFSNPVTGMIEGNSEYNESIIKRLHKVLRPFLLRRLKSEVEKQMPKKYEHVVMCRLSKRQRFLYDDYMSRAKTKETLASGNLLSVINVLMQLRKVCNHPNLFEVRPTISPFQCEGITLHMPSLVYALLEYNVWEHVNLLTLNLNLLMMEFHLSAYQCYRSRALKTPRKIIEINASPEYVPPCPPSRLLMRIKKKPNAKDTKTPADKPPPPPTAPNTKLKIAPQYGVQLVQHHGGIVKAIPVNISQGPTGVLTTQTSNAGSVLKTDNKISASFAQLVQTSTGKHLLLTSNPNITGNIPVATTTAGQKLTFLSKPLSATGNANQFPKAFVRFQVTAAPGVPTNSVTTTCAPPPPPKTDSNKVGTKFIEQLYANQSNNLDVRWENDGTVNDDEMADSGTSRLELQETLRIMADCNERRCSAVPLYGNDFHEAVKIYTPIGGESWFNGRTHCLNTLFNKSMQTTSCLAEALRTPKRRIEELSDVFDKFILYVPAVKASEPEMQVWHPPPSVYWGEKHNVAVISKVFSKPATPLHRIASAMVTQFPDPRLIQYDCGKLQTLDKLLRELKSGSHRVLIFTQMTKMLDVLEAFLNFHGHIYLRLDGTTKVDQRQVLMERFNGDTRIFAFILSTRSGGVGVNLTGADTVIFYDSDWNPTMDAQAQDRCHRIGQTRDVHIYRLVSERTIEENILKKANQKRLLGDLAIEGGNFTTAYFKSSTIQDLFNIDANEESAANRMLEVVESNRERDRQREAAQAPSEDKAAIGALENALAACEDDQDVQAARTAKAEAVADLAEFDENIPLEETEKEKEPEMSRAEQEIDNIIKQLTPVERYAMKFIEETEVAWSAEQLKAAERQIEEQKREWEQNRIAAMKEEEERRARELEEENDLLTFTREDATNQVSIKTKKVGAKTDVNASKKGGKAKTTVQGKTGRPKTFKRTRSSSESASVKTKAIKRRAKVETEDDSVNTPDENTLSDAPKFSDDSEDDVNLASLRNHVDRNSPRTRSRGTVAINLWTLDVSPILPGVKPVKNSPNARGGAVENDEDSVEKKGLKRSKNSLSDDDKSHSDGEVRLKKRVKRRGLRPKNDCNALDNTEDKLMFLASAEDKINTPIKECKVVLRDIAVNLKRKKAPSSEVSNHNSDCDTDSKENEGSLETSVKKSGGALKVEATVKRARKFSEKDPGIRSAPKANEDSIASNVKTSSTVSSSTSAIDSSLEMPKNAPCATSFDCGRSNEVVADVATGNESLDKIPSEKVEINEKAFEEYALKMAKQIMAEAPNKIHNKTSSDALDKAKSRDKTISEAQNKAATETRNKAATQTRDKAATETRNKAITEARDKATTETWDKAVGEAQDKATKRINAILHKATSGDKNADLSVIASGSKNSENAIEERSSTMEQIEDKAHSRVSIVASAGKCLQREVGNTSVASFSAALDPDLRICTRETFNKSVAKSNFKETAVDCHEAQSDVLADVEKNKIITESVEDAVGEIITEQTVKLSNKIVFEGHKIQNYKKTNKLDPAYTRIALESTSEKTINKNKKFHKHAHQVIKSGPMSKFVRRVEKASSDIEKASGAPESKILEKDKQMDKPSIDTSAGTLATTVDIASHSEGDERKVAPVNKDRISDRSAKKVLSAEDASIARVNDPSIEICGNFDDDRGNFNERPANSDASGNFDACHGNSDVSRGNSYVSRGNFDVGRGNSDASRGNSDASRGNSDVSRGNSDASRGNSDASRGNSDASRGNSDASRGNFDASRGNSDVSRGNSDASRGNSDASRGNFDASRGNSDVSRGNSNASCGNSNVSRGNSYASRGNSDASRGNFDANRGDSDEIQGNSNISQDISVNRGNCNENRGNSDGSRGNSKNSQDSFTESHGNFNRNRGDSDECCSNLDASRGNSDASHGDSDEIQGNSNISQDISTVNRGNSNENRGNFDESRDNSKNGQDSFAESRDNSNKNRDDSDERCSNLDASRGNSDVNRCNSDEICGISKTSQNTSTGNRGNSHESHSNLDESHSNLDESRDNSDVSRGNSDKNRGNFKNSGDGSTKNLDNSDESCGNSDENRRNFDENRRNFDENRRNFDENRRNFDENRRNFDENRSNLEESRDNSDEIRGNSKDSRDGSTENRSNSYEGRGNLKKNLDNCEKDRNYSLKSRDTSTKTRGNSSERRCNSKKNPDNPMKSGYYSKKSWDNSSVSCGNSSEGRGNFGEGRSNFGEGRGNFDEDRGNFGEGRSNFGESRVNCGEGQSNFGEGRGNFDEGRGNFGKGRSKFGEGRGNFNEDRGNFDEGRGNFDEGRGNFDEGRGNFGEGRSNFGEGRSNFGEGRSNFGEGRGNFKENSDNSEESPGDSEESRGNSKDQYNFDDEYKEGRDHSNENLDDAHEKRSRNSPHESRFNSDETNDNFQESRDNSNKTRTETTENRDILKKNWNDFYDGSNSKKSRDSDDSRVDSKESRSFELHLSLDNSNGSGDNFEENWGNFGKSRDDNVSRHGENPLFKKLSEGSLDNSDRRADCIENWDSFKGCRDIFYENRDSFDEGRGNTDECRGNSDECRSNFDECRGNSDECGGNFDECQGTSDACRGNSDACRGNSDRCQGISNEGGNILFEDRGNSDECRGDSDKCRGNSGESLDNFDEDRGNVKVTFDALNKSSGISSESQENRKGRANSTDSRDNSNYSRTNSKERRVNPKESWDGLDEYLTNSNERLTDSNECRDNSQKRLDDFNDSRDNFEDCWNISMESRCKSKDSLDNSNRSRDNLEDSWNISKENQQDNKSRDKSEKNPDKSESSDNFDGNLFNPNQNRDNPNQNRDNPNQNLGNSSQNRDNPNQNRDNPNQNRDNSNQNRVNSNESRDKSNESRDKSNESRDKSNESRAKSNESRDKSNESRHNSNENSAETTDRRDTVNESRNSATEGRNDADGASDASDSEDDVDAMAPLVISSDSDEDLSKSVPKSKLVKSRVSNGVDDRAKARRNSFKTEKRNCKRFNLSTNRTLDGWVLKSPSPKRVDLNLGLPSSDKITDDVNPPI